MWLGAEMMQNAARQDAVPLGHVRSFYSSKVTEERHEMVP